VSEEDYKIAYENVMIANKILNKETERLNKELEIEEDISNGMLETIDKAIEYINYNYKQDYIAEGIYKDLLEILRCDENGNYEVETIEEDKKIEELDIYKCFHIMGDNQISRLRLDDNFQNISDKINEIINHINKEESND